MKQTSTATQLHRESVVRERLGGISPRKFLELRRAGVIGDPLELSPRSPRWTDADIEAAIARLQRRALGAEPVALVQARAARRAAQEDAQHAQS